jgi:hypothetical protein
VVLDACRADLWGEVAPAMEEVPIGATRISPAGTSTEWLEAVFGDREDSLDDVGYVTANPYSETHLDEEDFDALREVWRYAWDDDAGTVPPRPVTDAAIHASRNWDSDRLIVHYMQPHFPSLSGDHDDGTTLATFGEDPLPVWDDLRFGRRSNADVWRAYRANLRIVLRDVRTLLANVDADRVVLTADHGNAFGERGLYGHAAGIALRPIREVPWAVTTATDRETHDPPAPPRESTREDSSEEDVDERLRALGYR